MTDIKDFKLTIMGKESRLINQQFSISAKILDKWPINDDLTTFDDDDDKSFKGIASSFTCEFEENPDMPIAEFMANWQDDIVKHQHRENERRRRLADSGMEGLAALVIAGECIYRAEHLAQYIPNKAHVKKPWMSWNYHHRIQKKWNKRFGVTDKGLQAYLTPIGIICSPHVFDMLAKALEEINADRENMYMYQPRQCGKAFDMVSSIKSKIGDQLDGLKLLQTYPKSVGGIYQDDSPFRIETRFAP